MAADNAYFMNGVPELLLLRLLQGREMYGYELVQEIRRQTDETIVLAEGVVYPVLHGLERDGALISTRKTVNGRSRIYYALSPAGRTRLRELSANWGRLASAIQKLIAGGDDVQTA